jgi:hypothetical protein
MRSRPFRPLGLPIYVARGPAASFPRRYPRDFTFYVADPISSILQITFLRKAVEVLLI